VAHIEVTLELTLQQRNAVKQWIDDHPDFEPEKVYYDWDSAQNLAACPRVFEDGPDHYVACYVRVPKDLIPGEPYE